MVLVLLFQLIKTVGRLFIKVTAWLLVALSLWIPFAYTVLFVVIAGFLDASLSENSTLFWAGLVAAFVGSFLVSLFLHERRQRNKREFRAQKKQRLSGGERAVEREDGQPQQGFRCPYSHCHNPHMHPPASVPASTPAVPMPAPYSSVDNNQHFNNASYKVFGGYGDGQAYGGSKHSGQYDEYDGYHAAERAMVFALRSDPTVFVCEYPDRLEYFKRTRQGMVFMKSERK